MARQAFHSFAAHNHEDFTVKETGLHISKTHPFIGASPDGLITCKCHGKGVLEVKCPLTAKCVKLSDLVGKPDFCLTGNVGTVHLKRDHAFYYQIQCQLMVTQLSYADFVVWSPQEMFIERIMPDVNLQSTITEKSKTFFQSCILPEILGKWFTRALPTSPTTLPKDSDMSKRVVCVCRKPESATMISCQNKNCKIVKFHLPCVKLKILPKRKWFCCDCRVPQNKQKKEI